MRSINRMTIFATIAIALLAAPVGLTAQSRTGGSSRNSSSSSSSSSTSTSRPASSSQASRSSSSTSSSQASRSSSSQVSRSGSSAAQPSRSSSSQVNRGTTSTSSGQASRSTATQSTQPSRSSSSQVNRGTTSTSSGQASRSTATQSTQPSRSSSSQVNRSTTTQSSRAAGSTRQATGISSNLSNGNTTAVPTKGLDAVPRSQAASETAGIKARPEETPAPSRTGTAVSRTGGATSAAGQTTDRTGTAVSRTGGATSRAAQPRPQAGSMLPDNYRGVNLPRGEVRMDQDRNIHRIPPREREFMPYDRPVSFYRNAYHFYGCRVVSLPAAIVRSVIWGIDYYMWNNIYYRRYGDVYYISRPPFGVVFSPLDYELELVACRFNYFNNAYWTYRTINENAATIAQQNRIIAQNNATIAAQNAAMALNTEKARKAYTLADKLGLVQSYADASVEYYYDDGVFFILNSRGQYEVIVPPAGALVSELPDDYDVITIDGVDYYKVDDTIYHLTVVDGSPYLEVLGQLTGDLRNKYNLYK